MPESERLETTKTAKGYLRSISGGLSEDTNWAGLEDVHNESAFLGTWLAMQCSRIPGATGGILLLRYSGEASSSQVGSWPGPTIDVSNLGKLAEHSLSSMRPAIAPNALDADKTLSIANGFIVAVPYRMPGSAAAVAVAVSRTPAQILPETIID
jgi:hypothetical protein